MANTHDPFYLTDLPRTPVSVWLKHAVFFLVTLCTTTLAGVVPFFGPGFDFHPSEAPFLQDPAMFFTWAPTLYALYLVHAVYFLLTDQQIFIGAISFSLPLLLILFCHEMGHYIACRIYKVDCTLPYFIPTPPLVAAGTFGAVIRIKSPMYSRKVIFDIGVAGPIAGFIALIPVAVIGVMTMKVNPPEPFPPGSIIFIDPLFMRGMGLMFGKQVQYGVANSFYFAAWIGLLVTALNLIPSGQLDGGHAMYAALGKRIHFWTGRIAFVIMAVLSVVGMLFFGSPSGFLVAVILGVMMTFPHPEPVDMTPLDRKRQIVAILTLIIFILCFVPFPLQIT